MPRLSVWFIRLSLIYLLLGFALGALLLAQKGISFFSTIWVIFPMHMEFLLFGWLVQLAMGVAYWILPRFSGGAPRGKGEFIWSAFLLLNLGIWLSALQPWISYALLAGRLGELAGILAFVIGSWCRVRPFGASKS